MRWEYLLIVSTLGLMLAEPLTSIASDDLQPAPASSKGTWELSLASGYTYSYRRTHAHVTKLRGVPVILGAGIVATDPIGHFLYRVTMTLGGYELILTF